MARRIPAHIREQQINKIPNTTFVRWDDEYRNCYSKAVCRCDKDHEWSASADHLVRGRGCPECARKTVADKKRVPAAERVEQINKSSNIKFVRWLGEYHNAKSKAVCRCDKGHEWYATVNNLTKVNGHGCPECARKTVADKKRKPREECEQQINNLTGVTFIRWEGGYRNNQSKAACRCDKGHEWSANAGSLLKANGHGCPECAKYGYNPSKSGTLYALRSECGTMVKIGISNNYEKRHRQLVRATPFEWSCVELIHGDGATIAALEKAFHGMTESVSFDEPFDGYTEWRKWTPELTGWFDTWKSLTPKENENV